jgi:hypothetical protein
MMILFNYFGGYARRSRPYPLPCRISELAPPLSGDFIEDKSLGLYCAFVTNTQAAAPAAATVRTRL